MSQPAIQAILLPTDLSKNAAVAGRYASFLAEKFDAQVHVLYVLEDAMGKLPEIADCDQGFPAPGEQWACSEIPIGLQQATGIDPARVRRLLLATRMGAVSGQIVAYASEQEIDLIVLATHGRRGLARAIMGSVAEDVLRRALCPVLTVRPESEAHRPADEHVE